MLVDDFVMLGKAVPEPRKDGRVIVCSIGASESLERLIRIWPLAVRGCPKVWSVNKIELEDNPEDNRPGSFRIAGDDSYESSDTVNPWINDSFVLQAERYPTSKRTDLLAPHVVNGLFEANSQKLSMALLFPNRLELHFRDNWKETDKREIPLTTLDRGAPRRYPLEVPVKQRFRYTPMLRFVDEDGDTHNLQVRDWGGFEWMRKYGNERRSELAVNWHLDKPRVLLVGNFNRHRNSWLIISILRDLEVA